MALFHKATLSPSKSELLAAWVPTQAWCVDPEAPVEVIGAFRFDDPANQTGIETHLVRSADAVYQVPLTYRNDEVAGAGEALVGTIEHSALGTRWVYDGVHDETYVLMLASVAMTGQGEALGLVEFDGRWVVAPANVRIEGGGWSGERVPVDGFKAIASAADGSVGLHNDRFALTFNRRVEAAPRPPMGLSATWAGQSDPVLLAEVSELG